MVQSRKSDYVSPQFRLLLLTEDVVLASGNMEDFDVGKDTIEW